MNLDTISARTINDAVDRERAGDLVLPAAPLSQSAQMLLALQRTGHPLFGGVHPDVRDERRARGRRQRAARRIGR